MDGHWAGRPLLNQILGSNSQTRFLVRLPGFCRVLRLRGLENTEAEKSGTKQSVTEAEVKAPKWFPDDDLTRTKPWFLTHQFHFFILEDLATRLL